MKSESKCDHCGTSIDLPYIPMKEWKINGPLCGKCYSKKISEFYPGDHSKLIKSDKD